MPMKKTRQPHVTVFRFVVWVAPWMLLWGWMVIIAGIVMLAKV